MNKAQVAVGIFLAYVLARSTGAIASVPPVPSAGNVSPVGTGARITVAYARQLVEQVNAGRYGGWFDPSDVLGIISVESRFDPNAFRYEPALDDASIGLMQTLYKVAQGAGYSGPPSGLFDPLTSITAGMGVMWQDYQYLSHKLGRDPTKDEWIASYNQGAPSVAAHGVQVQGYLDRWQSARADITGNYVA